MKYSLPALAVFSTVTAELSGISYPYVNQQAFIDDMLAQHNHYRALHGSPPVTWNQDLANAALANAGSGTWAHTSNNPNGENIATGTYTDPDYYGFLWYDEVRLYDFNNPGFSHETGHFTQMVWAGTTQIGCAVSNRQNNLGYPYSMTCEYSPAGNIVNEGYFAANVKPLVTSGASRTATVKGSLMGLGAATLVAGLYMLM